MQGFTPLEDDELSLLQRRFRLMEQNVMSPTDFTFMYQRASLGTRMAFDAWRNRQVQQQYSNPLMQGSQVLAPPVVYLPPGPQYVQGPRREMVFPPPLFSPAPVPRALPEAVGSCSNCRTGLSFDPPRSQHPLTVRCPKCAATSSFQVCWTCPAIIPYDSTCRRCLERDKAHARNSNSHLLGPRTNSDAELAAALLASTADAQYQQQQPAAERPPVPFMSAPIPEEKGLTNRAGDNHCFLNVTIQSLWHLKPFRDLFEARPVQHPPQW
jgi:hypothetical protein